MSVEHALGGAAWGSRGVDGGRLWRLQDVGGVRGRNPSKIGNGILMPLARHNVRHRPELVTGGESRSWSIQMTNWELCCSINVNNLGKR